MTELHWRDKTKSTDAAKWQGLLLTVSGVERPGLSVEMCAPRCLRVSLGGTPRLWARVEDDYWGYDLVRSASEAIDRPIPPITPRTVEQYCVQPDRISRDKEWARHFAAILRDGEVSPLFNGTWHLGYMGSDHTESELTTEEVQRIVRQDRVRYVQWDFGDDVIPITLRDPSDPDSGRVKAWRKRARDGTLPRVLLLWVSGLDTYVVIDGHDRLHACLLEELSAPVFSLEPVRDVEVNPEVQQAVLEQVSNALEAARIERSRPANERLARAKRYLTADRANELLLNVFAPEPKIAPTRASIIDGGALQWKQEVLSQVSPADLHESELLAGLQ